MMNRIEICMLSELAYIAALEAEKKIVVKLYGFEDYMVEDLANYLCSSGSKHTGLQLGLKQFEIESEFEGLTEQLNNSDGELSAFQLEFDGKRILTHYLDYGSKTALKNSFKLLSKCIESLNIL